MYNCNDRAKGATEWGSEARETRSVSGQAVCGTKGLGFSMDAAPPWVASALFREEHDWAQGPAGARENKDW